MTRDIVVALVLQLLGVITIIAEFLIPSAGILTITAIGLFVYSLYYVFDNTTPMIGTLFVVADIILIPVLVIVGVKILAGSPITLRKNLSAENGVSSQPKDLELLIGKEGVVINDLHPAGKILVQGQKYDAISRGEFIEKGTSVIVHQVDSNRIIVKKK